ncbi:ribosomal protein L21-like protein [Scenedesmus sp. NREL 46B-D3]|nr:ribosomal protein L21-like protein [Scenedesmus sp. NREL 46B-D3]
MAGRSGHKLSLKRANNKASWAAVQPFLEQEQRQPDQAAAAGAAAAAAAKLPPIKSAIPPLPQLDEPEQHRRIGRITGPYSITRQAAFAVVESGGAQFKVTPDDVIYHNKIPGVTVNDVIELGKVLLVGSAQETAIGRPFIPGASVIAAVEETLKDAKVHVFKKKPRKGYSKLQGHRSHITALRILELRAPGMQLPAADAAAARAVAQQLAAAGSGSGAQLAPPVRSLSGGDDGSPAVSGIHAIGPGSSSSSSSSKDGSSSTRSRKKVKHP